VRTEGRANILHPEVIGAQLNGYTQINYSKAVEELSEGDFTRNVLKNREKEGKALVRKVLSREAWFVGGENFSVRSRKR